MECNNNLVDGSMETTSQEFLEIIYNKNDHESKNRKADDDVLMIGSQDDQNKEVKKPSGKSTKERKPQVRFNCVADINLLTEVVAVNPFSSGPNAKESWEEIANNLQALMKVNGRRCRERTNLLLSYYIAQDNKNLRKSGTEEEFSERDKLLQEIRELKQEAESVAEAIKKTTSTKPKKKQQEAEDSAKGLELRQIAMHSLPNPEQEESDEITLPSPKRSKTSKTPKRDVFSYLVTKHASDREDKRVEFSLRERELALKEKELELKAKKTAMEEEQQKQKLELEAKEKLAMIDLLQSLVKKT